MSFSSISGSHTSSTLYPLSTSHLHPIRKPYEFPSFDPPPPPSSSSKSIQSNSLLSVIDERPSSSFYKFEDNVNDEIREGLERLDLARKREKNVIQSTSSSSSSSLPDIPLRKSTSTKHPQNFFPVSYIRGEWMQRLLDLDLGKRKIRYFLSDETLCLGTPLAPITSDFLSGLTFYEAYTHVEPKDSKVYMSEEQVIWLIDELYSILGIKNSKLNYEDVNIDISKRVGLKDFKAMRKISFRNNVAGFRKKCGIPIITKATFTGNQKAAYEIESRIKQNWRNGITHPKSSNAETSSTSSKKQDGLNSSNFKIHPATSTDVSSSAKTSAITNCTEKVKIDSVSSKVESPSSGVLPTSAPKSFASMTKAERQARLQAQREEALRKHLALQRQLLPLHRQFYRNLEKHGGAALACDVESWTEDAEVLLELGMAWFVWTPSSTDQGIIERDGGSCHYIIEETIQYRNEEIEATRWDFSLGRSETLPQRKISEKLKMKIDELSKYGPLVLVFHDASAETRYFQRLGIDCDIFFSTPPADLSSPKSKWPSIPLQRPIIIIQDTQSLYAGWSNPQIKQINLGRACLTFGLEDEARKLHNAGNDAFATLRIWEILLEMEVNEEQSEARITKVGMRDMSEKSTSNVEQVQNDESQLQKEAKQPIEASFPDLIELW